MLRSGHWMEGVLKKSNSFLLGIFAFGLSTGNSFAQSVESEVGATPALAAEAKGTPTSLNESIELKKRTAKSGLFGFEGQWVPCPDQPETSLKVLNLSLKAKIVSGETGPKEVGFAEFELVGSQTLPSKKNLQVRLVKKSEETPDESRFYFENPSGDLLKTHTTTYTEPVGSRNAGRSKSYSADYVAGTVRVKVSSEVPDQIEVEITDRKVTHLKWPRSADIYDPSDRPERSTTEMSGDEYHSSSLNEVVSTLFCRP
jgi:hypothetical protein